MAKIKNTKREGVKKKTSTGSSRNSRVISSNKSATGKAKPYKGQGR